MLVLRKRRFNNSMVHCYGWFATILSAEWKNAAGFG
jgi:hypothetical protein